jgi:hypothetical protein
MKYFGFVIAVFAVSVACLPQTALSQEASGIPDEIVKELDSLVGTWESEGKVGDKEQSGGFTCRWARTDEKNKICLVGRFSYKTGDEVRSGTTLIGWNAAKKCIEDRGFDANGGNVVLYWKVKSPTQWQGEVVMVEDGQEVKSKAVLIKKGPSEIVMESESETGEVARFVFRKAKRERKKEAKN